MKLFDLRAGYFDICHDVYLTQSKCVCDILQIKKLIYMISFDFI